MDATRTTWVSRSGGRRTATFAAAAAMAIVGLTGCGSSGGGDAGQAAASASATPSPTEMSSEMSMSPSPSEAMTSTGPAEPSASSEVAEKFEITISDFEYDVPEKVSPGATVLVKNEDSVTHTVTAEDGPVFDVTIEPGDEASFVAPDTAGQYPFICTFHANMHGTLVVG